MKLLDLAKNRLGRVAELAAHEVQRNWPMPRAWLSCFASTTNSFATLTAPEANQMPEELHPAI